MDYITLNEIKEYIYTHKCQVCLFGAGFLGKTVAYRLLCTAGIQVDSYCDNNGRLAGTKVHEISVISPFQLYEMSDCTFVFISVAPNYVFDIREQLEQKGFQSDRIIETGYFFMQEIIESIMRSDDDSLKEKWKDFINDEMYLKWRFEDTLGYSLNLDNPCTFNEKMQWLKLYYRKREFQRMVDKYEAKKYAIEILPKIGIIRTIGVWDKFDDIDFDSLPKSFVIKCTHDSGSVIVVKDKDCFDYESTKRTINQALSNNLFYRYREWPYRDIPHRIIVEEYVQNDDYDSLPVYKFFCFSGKPMIVQAIMNDKKADEQIDYYDANWFKLNLRQRYPNTSTEMKKPHSLDEMLKYAEVLSKGFPFIRIDFFEVNRKAIFSEFTFYTDAGFTSFDPSYWDQKLGDLVVLPDKKCIE